MANEIIGKCPVCSEDMVVTQLECSSCHTRVSGRFDPNKFSRLNSEQLKFIETFIKLRGNIKEVEEKMGISYPTVRKKIDEVTHTLGFDPKSSTEEVDEKEKSEILELLDNGEIDYREALSKLKSL